MRQGVGYVVGWLLSVLLAILPAGVPTAAAAPGCTVDVRDVSVPVDGERATGRLYEPRGCAVGDALVVVAHGHKGSGSQYADYLTAIAARTATPIVSMDMRAADSVWRTGEWNPWAGWRDLVAITQWYRGGHPAVARTILWGWSQGALTSGLAAAHGPRGLFDYWVDTFGPSDAFAFWQGPAADNPPLRAQIERDAGGCTPVVCPIAYAERSPVLLAPRMGIRHAFLVHGTADHVVPFESSRQMRSALMVAGKPSSMYTIASGRDLTGAVVPGSHNVGPVLFEAGCVVERLVRGTEPLDGNRDYLVDIGRGIATAPPAPANAKCAA